MTEKKKRHFRGYIAYAVRNKKLLEMGYKSYQDYLNSELWKEIRTRVLVKNDGKCKLCLKPAQVAHHIKYTKSNLIGKRIKDIVPLCFLCHETIEVDERGNKRPYAESLKLYKRGNALIRIKLQKKCLKCGGFCNKRLDICKRCTREDKRAEAKSRKKKR